MTLYKKTDSNEYRQDLFSEQEVRLIHTQTHTSTYIHTNTQKHTHTHTHTHALSLSHTYTRTHTHTHAHKHTYTHTLTLTRTHACPLTCRQRRLQLLCSWYCNALQPVATHWNTPLLSSCLQLTTTSATLLTVVERTATNCNKLQYTATHCNCSLAYSQQ